MKRLFIIFFIALSSFPSEILAQADTFHLSLSKAIALAEQQSIAAFRNKNMYLSDYWTYKNYKALFLPSLNFDADVLDYAQGITREYNSTTSTYDYVFNKNLTTSVGLYVEQNIALTGGTLELNYDLNRYEDYGEYSYRQYASTPLMFSYSQSVFGYNNYKWLRRISPLEFEKAKKEYLYNNEQLHLNVVCYFFNLAQANNNLEIAKQKKANAEYRYKMGQKKYALGIMKRVDVLDLEVSLRNAEVLVNEEIINQQEALMHLNSFLKLPPNTPLILDFDFGVPLVRLDEAEILDRAISNNPEMLDYKLDLLYAESAMEKAKREKGFSFDLELAYGISALDGGYSSATSSYENGEISAMFHSPFERYSQAAIGIDLPIVDWGRRRGTYKIKKAQYDIARSEYEQDLANFKQQILIMVRQFNLLPSNIEAAAISDKAAQESYIIYDKYFKKGEADLINLISSINQRDAARRNYLSALYSYWYSYYEIRMYTLYDFVEKRDLEADFEALIRN